MSPTLTIILAVFAPLLSGLVSMLVPRGQVAARVAVALLGPVASVGLLLGFAVVFGVGSDVPSIAWMPSVKLNLAFHADQFGMFFALLVAVVALLITLYARAYFGPDDESLFRFYPSLHLFMTAMIGLVLSDGFMLMLLFWELTSISSFLLIGWERFDPVAVKKALQAFITTALGGLAMMGGLILLGVMTGAWSFSALRALSTGPEGLPAGMLLDAAFVLVFLGAASKSAQWPLHFWLPGAMAAPTPVSAYLHSATMVKAGVYLMGRLWPIMTDHTELWMMLLIPVGGLTMVFGAFVALQKDDLKQIFAYTTVSQLGLFICMYGLGAFEHVKQAAEGWSMLAEAAPPGKAEPNLIWDVTQILNHAMYKAPLFLLAGAIGHVASRKLSELRGLFHHKGELRILAGLLVVAAYGLAAGPGTLSFTAKEFFFYQIVNGLDPLSEAGYGVLGGLLVVAGVLTGMFNVAIFVRIVRVVLDVKAPPGTRLGSITDHGHSLDDQDHGEHLDPSLLKAEGVKPAEPESGHDAHAPDAAHAHHHGHEEAHGHGGGHGHGHEHHRLLARVPVAARGDHPGVPTDWRAGPAGVRADLRLAGAQRALFQGPALAVVCVDAPRSAAVHEPGGDRAGPGAGRQRLASAGD